MSRVRRHCTEVNIISSLEAFARLLVSPKAITMAYLHNSCFGSVKDLADSVRSWLNDAIPRNSPLRPLSSFDAHDNDIMGYESPFDPWICSQCFKPVSVSAKVSILNNCNCFDTLGYNRSKYIKATEARPRLGKEEVDILEESFKKNPKPTTQTKQGFAEDMGIDLARINVSLKVYLAPNIH